MTARAYILTLNNPPNPDLTRDWLERLSNQKGVVYVNGQLERGENGTLHIQAYVHFKSPQRGAFLKKFCKELHFQPVKVDNGASSYAMKEETRVDGPWEFGELPMKRNSKTDWDDIWTKAKSGKVEDIPADVRIRCYGNIKRIEKDFMELPNEAESVRGVFIWGMPGWGKTHLARSIPQGEKYFCKWSNKWWDGYQSEPYVIMDDIDQSHACLGHHIKLWLDKHPCTGETKGSGLPLTYSYFIITSNYSIETIWDKDPIMAEAIRRRCTLVEFTGDRQYTVHQRQNKAFV